jgi:hypothetical protein
MSPRTQADIVSSTLSPNSTRSAPAPDLIWTGESLAAVGLAHPSDRLSPDFTSRYHRHYSSTARQVQHLRRFEFYGIILYPHQNHLSHVTGPQDNQTTTPPTNLTQDRIKRCNFIDLILDTFPRANTSKSMSYTDIKFLYTTRKKERRRVPTRRPYVISQDPPL